MKEAWTLSTIGLQKKTLPKLNLNCHRITWCRPHVNPTFIFFRGIWAVKPSHPFLVLKFCDCSQRIICVGHLFCIFISCCAQAAAIGSEMSISWTSVDISFCNKWGSCSLSHKLLLFSTSFQQVLLSPQTSYHFLPVFSCSNFVLCYVCSHQGSCKSNLIFRC